MISLITQLIMEIKKILISKVRSLNMQKTNICLFYLKAQVIIFDPPMQLSTIYICFVHKLIISGDLYL